MAALRSARPVLLSLVMPCYNEESTIDAAIDAIDALAEQLGPGIALEIVAVDDASSDGTFSRLSHQAGARGGAFKVVRHSENRGKGAAIQSARKAATGDIIIIQDADLEYDPVDIPRLIAPILAGRADAVIGSRFIGGGEHRVLYFWHRVANGILTLLSNMLTDLNLTDVETGYKAFTRGAFANMHLTNARFGIEPEIVARLAQMRARVYEVPVSYYGRTYAEGKKITWRDGIAAIGHILRARLSARSQPRLARAPDAVRGRRQTAPARRTTGVLGGQGSRASAGA
ncbi:MAG: glycosyltransferase family 2 protein [Gemmatimonadota bacterium]|nr:glycosyltransferase family 2 protein [Gemmatimonadota bacterium]